MKFIKNTIQVEVGAKKWKQWKAEFKCELCGAIVEVLKSNGTKQKSCGCHKGTHGMSYTRIYQIWEDMKKRCDNSATKHYARYGGRGIVYDHKWTTFEGFYEDMEEGYTDTMTLDREDVNGNYCKGNCQWLTKQENSSKDSVGKTQSVKWVKKRSEARIQVDEAMLDTIYSKLNPTKHVYLLDLANEYDVSLLTIVNASKRYNKPIPANAKRPLRVHNKLYTQVLEDVTMYLELEHGNHTVVSACKLAGISKQSYYTYKKELLDGTYKRVEREVRQD